MDIAVHATSEPIAPEWDDLATRAGAPPFLRPGWFDAWWASFGRGRLEIATLRRDGRLAGVVPLCRRAGTLQSLSNVHSPVFAVLGEDASAERDLSDWLFAEAPLHTSLGYLDAAAPGTEALARAARAHRRRLFSIVVQRSPYIEIDGDWTGYRRGLAKRFIVNLRRMRRHLEREGPVSLEVADGGERLAELLEEVFRTEPSGWKRRRGTAIVSQAQTLRFYTKVAEWAARDGYLRLSFLRLRGQPLACEFSLEDARSYWVLKTGFDPAYRIFGPGKLLAHAMLERAFAQGLATFEFLGADEAWKEDWRPAHRELLLQHSFRRTPVGAGWNSGVAAWRLVGRPLAKRAVGLVR